MRRTAPITRDEFERRAGANLSPDRWYKPEVRPVEIHGLPCLVKDYGRRPWLWRRTVGAFSIHREAGIYRLLRGLPGVPRYFGLLDDYAFAVERILGEDVSNFRKGRLSVEFLDRLTEAVTAMHGRGVVHLDLRQRKNVLRGPGDRPWLIDFASGLRLPKDTPVFRMMRVADLSGIAKLRARHAPETLTDEDRRLLDLERFRPVKRRRRKRREERRRLRREERRRRKCQDSSS